MWSQHEEYLEKDKTGNIWKQKIAQILDEEKKIK